MALVVNEAVRNISGITMASKADFLSWKLREGRDKEWRRCPILEPKSSFPSKEICVKMGRLNTSQWEKVGALGPTAMFQRNLYFKQARAPRNREVKGRYKMHAFERVWQIRQCDSNSEE